MSPLDINQTELNIVQQTTDERWKQANAVELEVVDVEVCLHEGDHELTERPAIYWEKDGCNFIITKIAEETYRCQFFYADNKQFSTDIENYDSIGDCVISLLQVQADETLSKIEK